MPLDQLLAAYGYRIGADGTRERIPDGSDADKGPADHGRSAIECSAGQVQVKTEQRHSPRTRQQTKPEVKSEAAVAVKSEPAVGSRQLDGQAPKSPPGKQHQVRWQIDIDPLRRLHLAQTRVLEVLLFAAPRMTVFEP